MPKTPRRRGDPFHLLIETALQPGRYIPWDEGWSFVSSLESVADQIQKRAKPAQAVTLYEVLLDGCNEKAEEIDDSDGYLGTFGEDLVCRWIRARRAANADPDETARKLLDRMDDDPYGFCSGIERRAHEAFDRTGLQAFERQVRARFDAGAREPWATVLRAIYSAQGNVDRYVELCQATELAPGDCETLAVMLQKKRKFAEALAWVKRGLKQEKGERFPGSGYRLGDIERQLLKNLGRGADALQSAWAEFQAYPSKFTYGELMRYVSRAERAAWREKAMQAAAGGELDSLIELWLEAKEIDRLAERLRHTSDRELEGLSHYTTEPAAKRLAKPHPDVAAKVYRALGMRIVNANKSQYYGAALANLQEAKRCYEKAGQRGEWEALVSKVRRAHHRKYGFMPGFEKLAAGTLRLSPGFARSRRARRAAW